MLTALLGACGGGGNNTFPLAGVSGPNVSPPAGASGPNVSPPAGVSGPNVSQPAGESDPLAGVSGLKFWVGDQGPTGPVFSGPQQLPFLCRTTESGLGQPEVDNHNGEGHPVFQVAGDINSPLRGHSKTCSIKTRIGYFYYDGSNFKPFDPATQFVTPPADMRTTTVKGATVPFIVRVEAGTINRFMYTIAMLAPFAEATTTPATLDKSAWNEKLVYWLRGGVGIGHQQSTALWFNNGLYGDERILMPKILEQGFAVVSSSGNETGAHYNLRLAEETALMTKAHFAQTYGKPRFTIGLGISGGAVQQYVFAQNRPGLLDGGIPIESFPDMVTQTIPASDCPLLGKYFADEVVLDPASPWATWSNHKIVQGTNSSDTVQNSLTKGVGSTECINAWGTTVPTVLNPHYRNAGYNALAASYGYPANVFDKVKWTHWNDLQTIYGTDANGYAPIPLDNAGVQYGLGALTRGQISPAEFLRINSCAGGWKEQSDFVPWGLAADIYDANNINRSATCRLEAGTPAPRRVGALSAMRAAYTSGHVFTGQRMGIPMIDLRPYLEPELNIHNTRQSFSARARLAAGNPSEVKNQVVWFTGSNADLPARMADALSTMDAYLSAGTAPAGFVDKCVDATGTPIASGPAVWDGILNRNPPGACTTAYPTFTSPRMEAGESIKGDIFKCALKPVATALADGTYGMAAFTAGQMAWLNRVFPGGVCDFSRGDQGRPAS
ncbi:DUF6351 family protein [Variovorax sp. M-6]|uniref:DUF6351 family protein n=1 Tax=Variovorax sp. M-6 TaxID=3233041 RepID=UPI003F993A94